VNQEYHDITSRLGAPLWYDECGVPRYDPFEPRLCNNIYADEAVLLWVACQQCERRFPVAMSMAWMERVQTAMKRGDDVGLIMADPNYSLAGLIGLGAIHYGDPPCHGCVGDTMNCDDLRVLEYWHRGKGTDYEWARDSSEEVKLDQ
jgi:hypothetical protein